MATVTIVVKRLFQLTRKSQRFPSGFFLCPLRQHAFNDVGFFDARQLHV